MPADPVMPDPEDAPTAADLAPADPPDETPTSAPTERKTAVKAPVPTHGEMASAEQLAEGEEAVEEADRADD